MLRGPQFDFRHKPRRGRGDQLARIATPIARAFKLSCIDPATRDLRPESKCAKAKRRLNNGESPLRVLKDRILGE